MDKSTQNDEMDGHVLRIYLLKLVLGNDWEWTDQEAQSTLFKLKAVRYGAKSKADI